MEAGRGDVAQNEWTPSSFVVLCILLWYRCHLYFLQNWVLKHVNMLMKLIQLTKSPNYFTCKFSIETLKFSCTGHIFGFTPVKTSFRVLSQNILWGILFFTYYHVMFIFPYENRKNLVMYHILGWSNENLILSLDNPILLRVVWYCQLHLDLTLLTWIIEVIGGIHTLIICIIYGLLGW